MSTAAVRDGERIALRNVSWDLYTQLRDDPERGGIRMTYRRGLLELMSPSGPHERVNRLLESLVAEWCVHHRIPRATFGSTTYRREDRASGLEPDSCFYFENESLVREMEEIDLDVQPPPELAIEVEISHPAGSVRMEIYADLGVKEVWRTNGTWLRMFRLTADGRYSEVTESVALPPLTPDDLMMFLGRRGEMDETSLTLEFRRWMGAR